MTSINNLDEGSTMSLSRLFPSNTSLNDGLTGIEIKSEAAITPTHKAPSSPSHKSPLMQYSSFSQSRYSEQQDNLELAISAEEEKIEPLMQSIYQGIQAISDAKLRTLFTETFAEDVRNMPELQNVIRQSACANILSAKCCCMCCGLTTVAALAASAVSGLFVGVMGVFGKGAWSWSSVAVGAEYGAAVGGGLGLISASILYLNGFYQLVRLSQTTKQSDQIIIKLVELKTQYDVLIAERDQPSPVERQAEDPTPSPMRTVAF
jgi:hypothetical protein